MIQVMIDKGTWLLKKGLEETINGGAIKDVTGTEQARIAEATVVHVR